MQEYITSDRQIHWLSQVIAKVNRTFVPHKEDDSHTNLYFDSVNTRIYGRWIDTPKSRIILSLNLGNGKFEWLDHGLNIVSEIAFYDKEAKKLENGIGDYLVSIGMDTKNLSQPLHFQIPEYGIESLNMGDISADGLKSWIFYRELANRACFDILGYLQSDGEVRIWPHHFDTGIYTRVTEQLGLGFGLAMADPMIGEPYFYLAGYASGSTIEYNRLSELSAGKWETGEQWKGAVLTLGEITHASNADAIDVIRKFIVDSTSWYLNRE